MIFAFYVCIDAYSALRSIGLIFIFIWNFHSKQYQSRIVWFMSKLFDYYPWAVCL